MGLCDDCVICDAAARKMAEDVWLVIAAADVKRMEKAEEGALKEGAEERDNALCVMVCADRVRECCKTDPAVRRAVATAV